MFIVSRFSRTGKQAFVRASLTDVVVPNSKFIDDDVTNWTLLEAYCRIHIGFKVPYGADVDLITKIGLEAANNLLTP